MGVIHQDPFNKPVKATMFQIKWQAVTNSLDAGLKFAQVQHNITPIIPAHKVKITRRTTTSKKEQVFASNSKIQKNYSDIK